MRRLDASWLAALLLWAFVLGTLAALGWAAVWPSGRVAGAVVQVLLASPFALK